MPKKNAVAALHTGNALHKTLLKILFDSARRFGLQGPADFVVLSLDTELLTDFDPWDVRVVSLPRYDIPQRLNVQRPDDLYKLAAFSLTDYPRVLLLDATSYVTHVDLNLWRLPTPVFAMHPLLPVGPQHMLLAPDKETYKSLWQLATSAQFETNHGWNFCGNAPPWPAWHRRMFPREYGEVTATLTKEHSWNFADAGGLSGLLYYFASFCWPSHLNYHFPSLTSLPGLHPAELLLRDTRSDYWQAAADAGLACELHHACEQDIAERYNGLTPLQLFLM